MNFGQIPFKGRTDSTKGQGHLLHLVVDVARVLVTVLAMVLVRDVLRIFLNLVRAELLQLFQVKIVILQFLRVLFCIVVFANVIVYHLCDHSPIPD